MSSYNKPLTGIPISNAPVERRIYRSTAGGKAILLGDYHYKVTFVGSGETLPALPVTKRENCAGCGAPWTPSEQCDYCKRYR